MNDIKAAKTYSLNQPLTMSRHFRIFSSKRTRFHCRKLVSHIQICNNDSALHSISLIRLHKDSIKHSTVPLLIARDVEPVVEIYFVCFGIILIWRNFGNV